MATDDIRGITPTQWAGMAAGDLNALEAVQWAAMQRRSQWHHNISVVTDRDG